MFTMVEQGYKGQHDRRTNFAVRRPWFVRFETLALFLKGHNLQYDKGFYKNVWRFDFLYYWILISILIKTYIFWIAQFTSKIPELESDKVWDAQKVLLIKIALLRYTTLQTDQNHELYVEVYHNDENEISVKREISVLSKVFKKMLTRLSL